MLGQQTRSAMRPAGGGEVEERCQERAPKGEVKGREEERPLEKAGEVEEGYEEWVRQGAGGGSE